MSIISNLRDRLAALPPAPDWLRWPALLARLALGLMFVLSGMAKVLDAQSFMTTLPLYQLPDWMIPLGALTPPLEVALGLMLVLGIALRPAALGMLAMLLAFSAMLVAGIIGGELENCGCFGTYLETSPELGLLRNVLLMGLAVMVWRFYRDEPADLRRWHLGLLGAVLLTTGLGTGYTMEAPRRDDSLARVGEFFPDEDFIDELPAFAGQQLVFVFSAQCEHCWNAVANVQQLAEAGDPPLIGVAPNDAAEIGWFRRVFNAEYPIYRYDPAAFNSAFNYWPALYLLQDGLILGKEEGDIPSLKTFREVTLAEWEG